jgi:hypothetical protein
MISQYKNIEEILRSQTAISAERIRMIEAQHTSLDAYNAVTVNETILNDTVNSNVELHVYSNETWITGNHTVTVVNKIPTYIDSVTSAEISFISQPIGINLTEEFSNLNLSTGNFKIAVNFFKNLIGNYNYQHLRIDDISPDRTELRLRAIDSKHPEFLQQITNYINNVNHTSSNFYSTYLLNFSRNNCVLFVNSVVIGDYLYVKLRDPLPLDLEINFKCWVVEEQKPTYIDRVHITSAIPIKTFTTLASANWDANAEFSISSETNFKTWNELLGSSVQTSQQIVDSYFSVSLTGIDLNIDFSDFNNFIFYSSATERLSNFKFKLTLLEYYQSQSLLVSLISGSVATTNATDYLSQSTALISGFDAFEKYLYYESSSILTTHNIPVINPTVANLTGSYIQPIPKQNTTKPYTLFPVNSIEFNNWYDSAFEYARQYDTYNIHALIYAIPEWITSNPDNSDLFAFINMLGHHYDIIYTYVNHMSKIHSREENPKLGMPNELLYSVAKQFGWNLSSGNQYQDLWEYVLGTNDQGIPTTGSLSVGDPAVSGKNMTYAVWRRIVNNLPLLLKSKGTKRSVLALLSCYGIPQSMITIKEFGGPRLDKAPIYEKQNFDYALDLINSTSGTVETHYSQSIGAVEVRFRTDNVISNPTIPSTMDLISIGSNVVTIDYVSGTLGTIQINGNSSAPIEMFDGGWLSVLVRDVNANTEVIVKRSKYGKIVAEASASDAVSLATTGIITLGGGSTNRLIGQLQEFRIWTSSLTDTVFNNHVKAPGAYNGNSDAYDELIYRQPLSVKINHTTTGSLLGIQPRQSAISSSFVAWDIDIPYDSIDEIYYYDSISIGGGTYDDNKIRLEQNQLVRPLDARIRAERSQFDLAPLDSNKLGVYFSPQTMIDEDIIAQYGFLELDNLIGDPGNREKSYPDLIQRAQSYWKKYSNRNDINEYIKIFTLFDLSFFNQLKQLLPARANKLTGILVQPNILERSRDIGLPGIQHEVVSYESNIIKSSPNIDSVYLSIDANINKKILSITAQDDDQLQAYLTSSIDKKYNGTVYAYDYLYWDGTQYINVTSPFWKRDAILPVVLNSITSEIYSVSQQVFPALYGFGIYGSSYYGNNIQLQPAAIQDYLPQGVKNSRHDGSKMTSPDFNVNSLDTIDGGPVVEWRTTNPNQLIYQTNGDQGSFIIT